MSNLACAEATCLWLTENYTDCQATLQKIESETKADPKLAHNLLVVEHVLAGSTDADRIASQLELIASDRLAADDGASSSDVVAAPPRSRSSGVLETLPLVPIRDDLAVAQLNRAILLFRQHRYASAAELLEPLAANAEALAEGTALRVLTLLLDCCTEGRQLPRAVAVLHSLERMKVALTEAYGGSAGGGGAGFAGGGPGGSGGVGFAGAAAAAGAAGPDGVVAVVQQQQGAGPSSGVEAGCVLGSRPPPRSLALPRVSRWGSGAMVRSRELLEQQGRAPSVPDLKLLIRLYRSRLHALAHNTRAAKRELQAVLSALMPPTPGQAPAPVPAPGAAAATAAAAQQAAPAAPGVARPATSQPQQQPAAGSAGAPGGPVAGGVGAGAGELRAGSQSAASLLVAVRAQLELYRGRVRKATKLLLGLMQDPSFAATHRPLLLNNLGLVHHQQGKHTLALLYLSQALAAAAAAPPASATPAPAAAAAASAPATTPSPSLSDPPPQPQRPQPQQGAPAPRSSPAAPPSCSSPSPSRPSASPVPVPAVMYNAGLQHLLIGNYEAARGCFEAAASHYSNTPLLWLRTAEAALGLYRRKQQQRQHHHHHHHHQPRQLQSDSPANDGSPAEAAAPLPGTRGRFGVDATPTTSVSQIPLSSSSASASAPGAGAPDGRTGGFGAVVGPGPAAGPAASATTTTTATATAPTAPAFPSSSSSASGQQQWQRPQEPPPQEPQEQLLGEAILALQTALQQLDAQQEEHEQWQSSSSKLEEGLVLPAMTACAAATTATAVPPAFAPAGALPGTADATTSGSSTTPNSTNNSAGGASGGTPDGAAGHAGPASTSAGPGTGAAEPLLPTEPCISPTLASSPQQRSAEPPGQKQQQGQASRPAGHSAGTDESRTGSLPHTPPHSHQGMTHQLANGLHEPHGTDASAALSEELRAVRRAVLANLSYAHLQSGDWCAALAAARALMDAAALVPIPTSSSAPAAPSPGSADPVAMHPASYPSSSSAHQLAGGPPSASAADSAAAAGSAAYAATRTSPAPSSLGSNGGGGGSSSGCEAYSFLATSYAAEALCHLDRPGDAVEWLSMWLAAAQEREAAGTGAASQQAQLSARPDDDTPTTSTTTASTAPTTTNTAGSGSGGSGSGGGREEVYPLGNAAALAALTGPAALAATYTNLAAVFAGQGELGQAAGLVRQALALQPGSGAAALLLAYCELAAGNTAAALGLLKRGQPPPL